MQRVSNPVIQCLLDDLFEHGVFSTEEVSVTQGHTNKENRARFLINTVWDKGEESSRIMITCMRKRDRYLCNELRLIDPDDMGEL